MTIGIERLRKDLIDYYGSASRVYPNAIMEVERVKRASYDELVDIAIRNNINLDKYEIHSDKKIRHK